MIFDLQRALGAFLTSGGKCDDLGSHSNEDGGQRLQLLSHRDQCRSVQVEQFVKGVQFESSVKCCKKMQEVCLDISLYTGN